MSHLHITVRFQIVKSYRDMAVLLLLAAIVGISLAQTDYCSTIGGVCSYEKCSRYYLPSGSAQLCSSSFQRCCVAERCLTMYGGNCQHSSYTCSGSSYTHDKTSRLCERTVDSCCIHNTPGTATTTPPSVPGPVDHSADKCGNYGGKCINQATQSCVNGQLKLVGSNSEILCNNWMSNNERCCMTSQITSGKENCDNYGGQCANQNNYRCNNGEFKLLGSNNELLCSAWSTNNERCCMAASPIVGTATTRAPSSVNTSVKPALNDATTTCGIQKVSGFKKRVIGGNVADKGEWPWQVSIIKSTSFYGRSFSHTCGGTIISPEWIVSAAHCFQGLTSSYNIRMRVGEHSQYVDEGTEYNAVVSKIMVHPQYSYSQNYNDIALVKLSKPLDITQKYIRAACLPSMDEISDFYNNDECYTTGWGKTSSAGSVSPILREVQSSLVSQSSCRRKWGSQIDSTKVCFGNGYKGACQGDSGGPLVCKKNGRYSLVGAVSFGSKSCTDPYVPTVYTSVAFYKSWIDQVMASN